MKKMNAEKGIVMILFIFVFVIFSFADKDSKKLDKLYKKTSTSEVRFKKNPLLIPLIPNIN